MEDYHAAEIRNNLYTFAREEGGDVRDALSLKVRHTLDAAGGSSHRFLYAEDYDELAAELDLPERTTGVYQGSGARKLGTAAVIVEHETGPEIVIFLTQAAAAVDPYVTLTAAVGTVWSMGQWVLAKLRAARGQPPPYEGYSDAQFIRFERRTVRPDGTVETTVLVTRSIDDPLLPETKAELLRLLRPAG